MSTPVSTYSSNLFHTQIKYWDIYVDDYCGLKGNKWQRQMVKRILFQALDKVFRPLDNDDTTFCQEPASIKKLKKSDACWTTSKIILGWLIDTMNKTICLPEHRGTQLRESFNSISHTQRFIAIKEWHKVIWELRSMSLAIPGCTGLFSVLQEAFRHEDESRYRLRFLPTLHGSLMIFDGLQKT